MLITTMDGFYVYYTDEFKDNNNQSYYRKQWSEKYPYYYEDEDFVYRFTLGDVLTLYDKKGLLDRAKGQTIFTLDAKDFIYLDEYEGFRNSRPGSFLFDINDFYEVRKNIITSSIEPVLNEYCNKHNDIAKMLGVSYYFHLPSTSGEITKAIDSPGLIVLMQGYPLSTNKNLVYNRFAMASSQIVKKQVYIVKDMNWALVYHREDCTELLEEETQDYNAFYSMEEAAKEGAFPCKGCIKQQN